MPQYVIERTIPGAGEMDGAALRDISQQSNKVLRDLGPDIQWVHSYVVADKIFCTYNAANEGSDPRARSLRRVPSRRGVPGLSRHQPGHRRGLIR